MYFATVLIVLNYVVFFVILSIQIYGFKEGKNQTTAPFFRVVHVLEMCIVDLGIDLASRESNSCLKRSLLEYHLAYGYELIEIKLK